MFKKACFTVGILLLVASSGLSAEIKEVNRNTISKEYEQCLTRSSSSVTEVTACVQEELKRQAIRLRVLYTKVERQQNDQQKQKFIAAHRAWFNYRNAIIDFYNEKERGPIAFLESQTHMMNLSAEKIWELETLVR